MVRPASVASLTDLEGRRDDWIPLFADSLREWLATGRAARLRVDGDSMRPGIAADARVVVVRCDAETVRIGDVLLYEDGPRLVCHRLVAHAGARLLTAGDAVRLPPVWIPAAAVVGRVVAVDVDGEISFLTGFRARLAALLAVGRAWRNVVAARLGWRRVATMGVRPAR